MFLAKKSSIAEVKRGEVILPFENSNVRLKRVLYIPTLGTTCCPQENSPIMESSQPLVARKLSAFWRGADSLLEAVNESELDNVNSAAANLENITTTSIVPFGIRTH